MTADPLVSLSLVLSSVSMGCFALAMEGTARVVMVISALNILSLAMLLAIP